MALHAHRTALAVIACAALTACASAAPPRVLKTAAPSPEDANTKSAAGVDGPLVPVIAPAPSSPMAAFAKRLAAVIDGAKPLVTTFPIDLDALPRVVVQESLDAKGAAKLDRSKLTEDPDLSVGPAAGYAKQYMLTFGFKDMSKVTFGHVRVQGQYGQNDGWFGDGFGNVMNAYMTCGGGGAELVPVHAETVRTEKDHVLYTMTDAVLDRQACKIMKVQKWTAKAMPLLPKGILYGFRACVGSCKESEELTLIFPRTTASAAGALGGGADHMSGSFSVVAFPIQKGGGGAFVARLNRRDAEKWQLPEEPAKADDKAVTPLLTEDAARANALFLNSIEVGVEVSQMADDDRAVAIAYSDIDPATLPPPPAAPKALITPNPTPAGRLGFDDPLGARN